MTQKGLLKFINFTKNINMSSLFSFLYLLPLAICHTSKLWTVDGMFSLIHFCICMWRSVIISRIFIPAPFNAETALFKILQAPYGSLILLHYSENAKYRITYTSAKMTSY
jgi:hypothetical protein